MLKIDLRKQQKLDVNPKAIKQFSTQYIINKQAIKLIFYTICY